MIQNKKNLSLVFFKILTCLNTSKFRHKSIGESFKLIWWFSRVLLNTTYKICMWKQKGGQKETRECKYQKVTNDQLCSKWPIYILKVLSENQKYLPTWFYWQLNFPSIQILYAVLLNAYKSSNQLETFSNRFLAKFPYIWTPETGQLPEKHRGYVNFDFDS